MNWIAADLIMFVCSAALYLAVRKAALDKLPVQFNNLAMFTVPFMVFLVADCILKPSFGLTLSQGLLLLITAIVLSYYGNAMSLRSIALAPNAGYSLVLSKSYVVLTSILAVPLFGARLTVPAIIAITLIVASSACIMISRKVAGTTMNVSWIPLALGSFVCWALLSLVAKYLIGQGMPTMVFLTYMFAIVVICIVVEMRRRAVKIGIVRRHFRPFLLIGITASGFNFFNFYAISIAPNVGYVNATNAASIGLVTILSAVLFKDELTKRKIVGVSGVIVGLLLLFVWK